MIVILDANLLMRTADTASAQHRTAIRATAVLAMEGETLGMFPQCGYEFWVAATRPVANNGLGLTTVEAERELANFEKSILLITDPGTLFTDWRNLVTTYDCKGKVAHDARIAAAMQAHGLTHILTFNGGDFARFPFVTALDPAAVAARHP